MKKIFIALFLVLVLTGCKTQTEHIPLVIYSEADPYIDEFKDNIISEGEGLVEIMSYNSQNSQIIQNEIIEQLIKNKPKVLIVNPVDRLGAYTIIDKVKAENIPTIFINRQPLEEDLNSWNQVYYIGAPAENSAILQAEMIIDLFGPSYNMSELDKNNDNKIQVVLLKGEQGHQDAEIRTTVILDELEDYGYNIDLLALEVCNWSKDEAYDFMNEILLDYKDDIELVISNNDNMAIGAIDALVEHEVFIDENNDSIIDHDTEQWIPVVGIDGITAAVELIESGYLYGTVLNDSESMAKAIIELTVAIIEGKDPNSIGFRIVDNKYIWVDYKKFVKEEN